MSDKDQDQKIDNLKRENRKFKREIGKLVKERNGK